MKRFAAFALSVAACGGAVASTSDDAGVTSFTPSGSGGTSGGGGDTAVSSVFDASPTCSPVGGTYERGKGSGAPDCCADLTEVAVQALGTGDDGGAACFMAPLAVFICIQGKCGDGICEAPENQLCTCPQDCAGTVVDGG